MKDSAKAGNQGYGALDEWLTKTAKWSETARQLEKAWGNPSVRAELADGEIWIENLYYEVCSAFLD